MARFSGRKADLTPACHIPLGLHHVRLNMTQVTQERVQKLFEYRDDGHLIRKTSTGSSRAGSVVGHIDDKGYRKTTINRKSFGVHQLVWLYHYGSMPCQIDHNDKNPANNKIENLRVATQSENQQNIDLKSNNKSGYKGVYFHKATSKYASQLRKNGRCIHLGLFLCPKEAALAYNEAAVKYFGEFARLNPINE